MKLERLQGTELKNLFHAANLALKSKKDQIDALNVFPVPDGDTGTNMSLTFQAATEQTATVQEDSASKVASSAAQGSLMGARGNSGVILSQLLRGFALSLGDKTYAGPKELAQALQSGVETAYKGVKKPVEGTILTVSRLGAAGAVKAASAGADLQGVLGAACVSAKKALDDTPNQLPVLKQVGVVDAGGMGWLIILQSFLDSVSDGAQLVGVQQDLASLPAVPLQSTPAAEDASEAFVDIHPLRVEDIRFRYCTEFLVKGIDLNDEDLRAQLEDLGDSLLVVGDTSTLKIHVHSNHPGQVLEICLQAGTLHNLHINNMVEQFETNRDMPTPPPPLKDLGLVAVANGEGLTRILTSLGVDKVVAGGQTSNPSTQDLLAAVNEVAAEKVIILPNNSNIILAAGQAQSLAEKAVEVIPSKSIPQGIAALVAFNPVATVEANVVKMQNSLASVDTVEITYAVRDSQWDGQDIKKDDILGLVNDQITIVGQDIRQVVISVLSQAITADKELVTLYYGENVTEDQASGLQEELAELYPQLEFEVLEGGQPLYYYIISIE